MCALLLIGAVAWARATGPEDPGVGEPGVREGRFQESPMLSAMVQAGELPAVDDRLPPEPVVIDMLGPVGQYTEQIQVFNLNGGPWGDFGDMTDAGPYLARHAWDGSLIGDTLADWNIDSDYMGVTMTMREGIRWSDGQPMTVDDMLFAFNDMHLHQEVSTWGTGLGQYSEPITVVDEWTVRLELVEPNPNLEHRLGDPFAGPWGPVFPSHYLSKWHIDHNDEADELAQEEGFDHWYEALHHHFWWNPLVDLEKPVYSPWAVTRSDSTIKVSERNAYFYHVDPDGNQLPYIDRVVSQIVDKEVYNLKIVSGETDFAFMHTSFDDFTLLKASEAEGDYTVYAAPGGMGTEVGVVTNWNNADPQKDALSTDLRFRVALSLAIDRDEINTVVYKGQGVPGQATIQPKWPFYQERWLRAYADYDPEEANRLLDEIGMSETDSDGFRLNPDGTPFHWVLEYGSNQAAGGVKVLELLTEYWADVGLRVSTKAFEPGIYSEREHQGLHDFKVRSFEVAGHFRPGAIGGLWGDWLTAETQILRGTRTLEDLGGEMPGIEPPQWVKDYEELFRAMELMRIGSPEYNETVSEIMDMQAENLFWIGTVGLVPDLIVAKNDVKNVFTEYAFWMAWWGVAGQYFEQIWIDR